MIKKKEATAIINSLLAGVVPNIGVQHIAVGRKLEVEAMTGALDEVKSGHNAVKFWIGDFGSGKSFMLHLLNTVALKQNFVVAQVDFTPENRLYSNDKKALALFSSIMNNISIKSKPEGGALQTILDKWIERVLSEKSKEFSVSISDIQSEEYLPQIKEELLSVIYEISDVGGIHFGEVISKYCTAYLQHDTAMKLKLLLWLKGEYKTKTESRAEIGVREIINDGNYYDMLKNYCRLFTAIGYSGFMLNLDEAINLYKIPNSKTREKNYEKILAIYNDCFQGKVSGLFVNFAGTTDFLQNERRGLFSYDALKTRLEANRFETSQFRDFSQPVIKLLPIDHNEIFVLLKKLREIFNTHYEIVSCIEDRDIHAFMEEMYNKPGASEFLTPREVIRGFLNILNMLRQNTGMNKKQIFKDIVIQDERPDEVSVFGVEEV